MTWEVFVVGIVVGLGVAAILHGLFDGICDYLKTKKGPPVRQHRRTEEKGNKSYETL